MGDEVKVNVLRMSDECVDHRSCLDIEILTSVIRVSFVSGEETNVMSLLNHKERNLRFIVLITLCAGSPNRRQFNRHHFSKLAFTDTVTRNNNNSYLFSVFILEISSFKINK